MSKYFVTRIIVDVYSKGHPYKLGNRDLKDLYEEEQLGEIVLGIDVEGPSSLSKSDFMDGLSLARASSEQIENLLKESGSALNEAGLDLGDGWYEGVTNFEGVDYFWQAKVYQEGSLFGINGGGVSKLVIVEGKHWNPNRLVYSYDRGDDVNEAPEGLVDQVVAEAEESVIRPGLRSDLREGVRRLPKKSPHRAKDIEATTSVTTSSSGYTYEDEEDRYVNHYRCPYDGEEWDDSSPYMNNDRCPKCNAEIEPYDSEEITQEPLSSPSPSYGEDVGLREAKQKKTFEQWMKEVDEALENRIGLSTMDIADCAYADWYEDGVSPKSAASRAIKNEMSG